MNPGFRSHAPGPEIKINHREGFAKLLMVRVPFVYDARVFPSPGRRPAHHNTAAGGTHKIEGTFGVLFFSLSLKSGVYRRRTESPPISAMTWSGIRKLKMIGRTRALPTREQDYCHLLPRHSNHKSGRKARGTLRLHSKDICKKLRIRYQQRVGGWAKCWAVFTGLS